MTPWAGKASMSSSQWATTSARRASMRRGEKNGRRSWRKAVWYGGSDEMGGTTMPKSVMAPKAATSGLRDE